MLAGLPSNLLLVKVPKEKKEIKVTREAYHLG
jgi:hypothetical protein